MGSYTNQRFESHSTLVVGKDLIVQNHGWWHFTFNFSTIYKNPGRWIITLECISRSFISLGSQMGMLPITKYEKFNQVRIFLLTVCTVQSNISAKSSSNNPRRILAKNMNKSSITGMFLSSFTLSQPANHLFIKINLLRNIYTKFSHACCSLCR